VDGADRNAPIELDAEEFRRLGHGLVDDIADFLGTVPERKVAPGQTADEVRDALGRGGLPEQGTPADELLAETARLLFEHSTFNGHPRFLAYITASAAPIGALGDLLAATVNPNVGGWALSPVATEIEAQTVRWIAELLGYPTDTGGLFVSGGNMANFIGFVAARRARAAGDVRADGTGGERLTAYARRRRTRGCRRRPTSSASARRRSVGSRRTTSSGSASTHCVRRSAPTARPARGPSS
jgi:aromatic-L-amino-acid decarboxylase